jgi:hypothetical protein
VIGVVSGSQPLDEGRLPGPRRRRIESVEADRELAGREVEVLHSRRMERVAVARRREGHDATIRRRAVNRAGVRSARESEREAAGGQQSDDGSG